MHERLRIIGRDGRVKYQWLEHGRAGNVQTLREMAKLVREDIQTDVGLQDYANGILLAAGVRGNVRGLTFREIEAIFNFVKYDPFKKRGIIFRRDPTGGFEAIQDPRITIKRGFGDCDDFAVLLATLLGLVGYPTRFVVIKVNPDTNGFDHVYLEVLAPGGKWLALDPTNEKAIPGWEAHPVIERRTFKIFSDNPAGDDLEGFKSFFKKIGKGIAKVGKVALKVAPVALSIGIPGVGTAAAAAIGKGVSAASGAVSAFSSGGGGGGGTTGSKEAKAQFEQLVLQGLEVFKSVEGKSVITQADYEQAASVFSQLDSAAQELGASKWNDPNYRQGFASRLADIRSRVSGAGASSSLGAIGSPDTQKLLLYGGAAVVGLLVVNSLRN